ncbi:MAG: N-acetylmuramoyl-L-alanine amidase, partial [Ruminococcus sp.]|nr:N-acetylmuramoyl-L-alanine amidase [Ruminococcus sp.]
NEPSADKSSQTSTDTESAAEEQSGYSSMNIRVCIDPGHGDYDTGTVAGDGIVEAEQNLEISLLIRDYLESCGVSVAMTREADVSVSLYDRCSIANEAGCDFFVSIHRNSVSDTSTDYSGIEAWVNNKAPAYDTALAQNILSALDNVGVTQDLGIKYGYRDMPGNNYQVNMDTVMPSCLLELGYVTSEQDNELFLNNKQQYAKAIGDAIIDTAIQLGVINEDGERLMSGQLISDDKNNVYIADANAVGGELHFITGDTKPE